MKTKELKKATLLRLTPTAKELLEQLAHKWGISQADVVEIAIRQVAEQENTKQAS